ncbi:MAG: hypothetical protein MK297_07100 [Planctomycetes bacterium]|nr:hypothetical protein [Planctomycetota bacterium]
MKRTLSLAALAILASPLLISWERRGTEISFAVKSGSTLTKSFEFETEMTLDNFDMTMNGQEPPMMPGMDMTVLTTINIEVEDTYSKVEDGRPTMLTRSFEALTGSSDITMELDIMGEVQNQDMSMASSSVLEGETVEFVWSKEEEAHEPVLPDGSSLEEEDVDGLVEDMDFRSLLPDDEVDEGDEWDVPLESLHLILAPGGDTKLIPEEMEEAGGLGGGGEMGSVNDYFNEDVEGEFTATFAGMRKIEDAEYAVIKFSFELTNAVDLTDQIRESMEDSDLPEGVGEMEIEHTDIEIAYEGEGELTWDLDAGHFHTFEASGEFELLMEQGMIMNAMGQEMSLEQTMELSGSLAFDVSAE